VEGWLFTACTKHDTEMGNAVVENAVQHYTSAGKHGRLVDAL
jgi:hypothetical protein